MGLGETDEEVVGAMADLAGVGVDIVTIGQYLRPTTNHLPIRRWVEPPVFDAWRAAGSFPGDHSLPAKPPWSPGKTTTSTPRSRATASPPRHE